MSSPFDNIDIPSDEPPPKAKYAIARRRLFREMIVLGFGITTLSSLTTTVYDAIVFEGDLDCLLRPIGGFIGGFIGTCVLGTATFLLGTYLGIRKEVFDGKQRPFEGFALGGCLAGALFGSAFGAKNSTTQAEGKEAEFLNSGLLGGAIAIMIYAIYKYWQWKRRKSNFEVEDYR